MAQVLLTCEVDNADLGFTSNNIMTMNAVCNEYSFTELSTLLSSPTMYSMADVVTIWGLMTLVLVTAYVFKTLAKAIYNKL